MANSLEENLTCSICLSIYVDPLVLGCSHSFCSGCLQNCWKDKTPRLRECPLCRLRISNDPPPNLVLRNVCEAYLQARAEPPVSNQQRPACSIKEDLVRQKKDLTKNLLLLESRLKGLSQLERECESADSFMSEQVKVTEKLIHEEFEKMQQFLKKQEESRLRAVKAEERQKRKNLKDKLVAVREQRAAVAKTISDVNRKLQDFPKNQRSDRSMLRRYQSLVDLTQQPLREEELQLGSGALLDQAKHLGNLGFHIWSSLRSQVQYCPVVLDPNTASTDLRLSADLCSMNQEEGPCFPLNAERLSSSYWSVLGAEGFSEGVHTWDVDVSRNGYWALGVASRCERLPGVLSELWRVSRTGDSLEVGTLSESPIVLSPPQDPRRVRVDLDLDRRVLSFFDPDSASLLHSFTLPPTGGALFPYFFTGDHSLLQLCPKEIQVSVSTI